MLLKAIVSAGLISSFIVFASCGGDELDQPTKDSINAILAHRARCESLVFRIKRRHQSSSSRPGSVPSQPPDAIVSGFRGVADTHNGLIRRLGQSDPIEESQFEEAIDRAFMLNRDWMAAVSQHLHETRSFDEVALKKAWLQVFRASRQLDQKQKEAVIRKVKERATMRFWNQITAL